MTKTINNRKNMTTQELEAVSGGVVPWAARYFCWHRCCKTDL